jgi:hypothetical protein
LAGFIGKAASQVLADRVGAVEVMAPASMPRDALLTQGNGASVRGGPGALAWVQIRFCIPAWHGRHP